MNKTNNNKNKINKTTPRKHTQKTTTSTFFGCDSIEINLFFSKKGFSGKNQIMFINAPKTVDALSYWHI